MKIRRFTALPVLALLLGGAADGTSQYARAMLALESGQPRVARIELLNAIKINPDDARAHLLQGQVYVALKNGIAAEAELKRALELGVNAAQVHHVLAQALLLQHKVEAAREQAAKAPQRYAGEAHAVLGQAHLLQGELAEAQTQFTQSLRAKADNSTAWVGTGRVRIAEGDLAGARAAAARALQIDQTDLEALLLQGDIERMSKRPARALAWFERAAIREPNDVAVQLGRAYSLSEAGRMKEMLAATRSVLAHHPGNPRALLLQSRLAAMAENFALARSLLMRTGSALEADPEGMLLEGIVEYRVGNFEQAISRLSRLVAMQAGNWKARRFLAAAQWRAGSPDAVIVTLEPLLDSIYADRFVLNLIGKARAATAQL